jgi:hypothetical protein
MQGARKVPLTSIRFPLEIKGWLKSQADKNRRSLNGEVVVILEEVKRQQEQAHANQT